MAPLIVTALIVIGVGSLVVIAMGRDQSGTWGRRRGRYGASGSGGAYFGGDAGSSSGDGGSSSGDSGGGHSCGGGSSCGGGGCGGGGSS